MMEDVGRTLRMLGFDVLIRRHDEPIEEFVRQEGIIITKRKRWDEKLRNEIMGRLFIFKDNARREAIVAYILNKFGLPPREQFFSRCLICNTPLIVPDEIPDIPGVDKSTVRYCPVCKKYYWEGSHTRRMMKYLEERIFPLVRDDLY